MVQEVLFNVGGLVGRANLTGVLEYGDDGFDTLFDAELLEVFEGDASQWNGRLLESEIIRVYTVDCDKACLYKLRKPKIRKIKKPSKWWKDLS